MSKTPSDHDPLKQGPGDADLPDAREFRAAMRKLAGSGRPDVAVRAAAAALPVGPAGEGRAGPDATRE